MIPLQMISHYKKTFFLFFIFGWLYALPGSATEIIVNNSISRTHVTKSELRAIFTMRQRFWDEGKKIHVLVLPDNDVLHRDFAKHSLGIFPHQLRRTWDRQVFSGTGQAPSEVDSEQEMLDKVSNTPNAIGYFQNNPDGENVHVLEIK